MKITNKAGKSYQDSFTRALKVAEMGHEERKRLMPDYYRMQEEQQKKREAFHKLFGNLFK